MALRKKAKPEEQGNQEIREQVDEMKIVKFESMVEEIRSYLWAGERNGLVLMWGRNKKQLFAIPTGRYEKLFDPRSFNLYLKNPLVSILNKIFINSATNYIYNATSPPDKNNLDVISELEIIEFYKTQLNDSGKTYIFKYKSLHEFKSQFYAIIFWLLFAAAIDDDIYNNELSGIIDLAYCLDFDEHMITDWCRAVEYVLSGNKLSEDCDLQCDTVEGAMFFLHKEDE